MASNKRKERNKNENYRQKSISSGLQSASEKEPELMLHDDSSEHGIGPE